MIPKTSVRPAAIRNSITPSCSPLSACSRTRKRFMARKPGPRDERRGASVPSRGGKPAPRPRRPALPLLHRAFLGVGILVVGEHRFLDLHHRILAGGPGDRLQEVEVLDREVVGVVAELAASGSEVRLLHR